MNNINLDFDFTGLPFQPQRVTVMWQDVGGTENIAVNGQPLQVGKLTAAPLSIALGVTLTFQGPVQQLLIGGQKLWVDQVCAGP